MNGDIFVILCVDENVSPIIITASILLYYGVSLPFYAERELSLPVTSQRCERWGIYLSKDTEAADDGLKYYSIGIARTLQNN